MTLDADARKRLEERAADYEQKAAYYAESYGPDHEVPLDYARDAADLRSALADCAELDRLQGGPRHQLKGDLLLLKLAGDEPLYFVIDQSVWWEDEDVLQFAVEENSCPINFLQNITNVIYNGDSDPHGILEFIQQVKRPPQIDQYPRTEGWGFWHSIFDKLPEPLPDEPG